MSPLPSASESRKMGQFTILLYPASSFKAGSQYVASHCSPSALSIAFLYKTMFSTSPTVSIGVHLCVTVQYLHYISDEYQITDGGKTHKRNLLRGGAMHSTISMGQVGLAFSRRQQFLFKIKIMVFPRAEACKFPDVLHIDRQTEN